MGATSWVKETLESRKVPYQVGHHPSVYTAREVAEREHIAPERMVKVVAVMADGRPVAVALPANRRLLLGALQDTLRAKHLRLASESEIETYFDDCDVGAIPPLPHWENIELWMDKSMQMEGDILFQGGTHEDAVRVRYADWARVVNPGIGDFSAELSQEEAAEERLEGRWIVNSDP